MTEADAASETAGGGTRSERHSDRRSATGQDSSPGTPRDTHQIRQEDSQEDSSKAQALQLALKSSRIGVFDLRLPEGQGHFSDECLHVLGYGPEQREAFLCGFTPLVHPQDRPGLMRQQQGTPAFTCGRFEEEVRRMRADGSYAWVRRVGEAMQQNADGTAFRLVGTMEDVNARHLAELALAQARQEIRDLSAHVEAHVEAERKLIAAEVHDQCGQVLTLVKMETAALLSTALQGMPVLKNVQRLDELVDELVQLSRDVIARLRPPALDLGLVPALEWLAGDWTRQTGMTCEFSCAVDDLALPDDKATTLFRIVQECLTNATRHSGAGWMHVGLALGEDGLDLRVADNGRGFDPGADHAGHFGLLGMRERAERVGARLEVISAQGAGTQVRLSMPLPANAAA
ncbi:MAG: PAS domain-containing protein [Betaproteobacteria bacterium]